MTSIRQYGGDCWCPGCKEQHASGLHPSKGWGGKAADAVVHISSYDGRLAIMVAYIINTLQQFTGVSIAALRVNHLFSGNALWQYVRQPGDTTKMILEKSDFMATRMTSYQFEIQRAVDELLLDPSKFEKLQELAKQHGYFMQQETQGIVDTITWLGAYNQAVEANEDEKEAVRRADSAVRMTQGSFAPEDVSRIETGSPFMRAFTHFYSYFNMMANVLGTEFANVSRNMGVKAGAGKMLYIYTFGYMIPAVLSEMIVQAAGGFDAGDDDEYDLWDAMRLFFTAQARPLAAMVPGIGPAVLAGFNTFNSKPYAILSTSRGVSYRCDGTGSELGLQSNRRRGLLGASEQRRSDRTGNGHSTSSRPARETGGICSRSRGGKEPASERGGRSSRAS
jgi:hypothetical protein